MKKLLLKIVAVTAVLSCTGCGGVNTEYQADGEKITVSLSDSCELVLNKIPAATFKMGSYESFGEEDEQPVREITLTEDYYMGIYEVTQEQWEAVMGSNPSANKGEGLPVETVSWDDANKFCRKLSDMTGLSVSLPTEAQWENACRAGTESRWFFGDDLAEYTKYAQFAEECTGTLPVGSFEPNQNGLYDLYGNVMEWCLDYYSDKYIEDDLIDPKGSDEGDARVSRGGGWGESSDSCRSGYRNACGEDTATDGIGFRVVVNGFNAN